MEFINALFPALPGQQILTKSTHRRVVATDRIREIFGDRPVYGPVVTFPFIGNSIYSYPTDNPAGANENWRVTIIGWFAFFTMSLAIASFSWCDMLIMWALSFGEAEILANDRFIPDDAWYRLYHIGFGISGVNGWLAGYLLARSISSRRNWGVLGGFMVLKSYIEQWWAGNVGTSHRCHFTTLLEGFLAGIVLEHYGPKPKPFQLVRKHIGKIVISIIVVYAAMGPSLEFFFPDPPGYTSMVAPPP